MAKFFGISAAAMFLLLFLFSYQSSEIVIEDRDIISLSNLEEIPPQPPLDQYGFLKDSFEIKSSVIRQNQNLYTLLRNEGVSPAVIQSIGQKAKGVVNLNRLIPGQAYKIYKQNDEAVAFVWHPNRLNFKVITWDEEIRIRQGSVPVERREAVASATIYSSLYETVSAEGLSQEIAQELADIFAWEIDFFSLRSGDQFRIIYEEIYANNEKIGVGRVKAAEFIHRGESNLAYFYDHIERTGYFDENGKSLQKELLKAPFNYSQRVSSGFSRNRFHPILRERRPHYGTDYAAPTGTPILAVGDGIVIEAQRRGANGNIVQIRHNGTYKTAYLHLNGFASGIKRGAKVKQGQVIGYVGSTGLATGPHLCYRMYVNDRPVNSLNVDLPAADALQERFMNNFDEKVNQLNKKLGQIKLSNPIASN